MPEYNLWHNSRTLDQELHHLQASKQRFWLTLKALFCLSAVIYNIYSDMFDITFVHPTFDLNPPEEYLKYIDYQWYADHVLYKNGAVPSAVPAI